MIWPKLNVRRGIVMKRQTPRRRVDELIPFLLPLMTLKSANKPPDRDRSLKVAALQAWFDRERDQVAMVRLLIQQAEDKPDDTDLAQCAVKSLCLRPSPDPALLARVLPLARRAVENANDPRQRACCQQSQGIAEYRAGNPEVAERLLILASEGETKGPRERWPSVQCPSRFFRAMILFRQGKAAEARQLFSEAEALMKPLPAADRLALQSEITTDEIIVWLAYKEARAMLAGRVTTGLKTKNPLAPLGGTKAAGAPGGGRGDFGPGRPSA